jgi:hypothetical protein
MHVIVQGTEYSIPLSRACLCCLCCLCLSLLSLPASACLCLPLPVLPVCATRQKKLTMHGAPPHPLTPSPATGPHQPNTNRAQPTPTHTNPHQSTPTHSKTNNHRMLAVPIWVALGPSSPSQWARLARLARLARTVCTKARNGKNGVTVHCRLSAYSTNVPSTE